MKIKTKRKITIRGKKYDYNPFYDRMSIHRIKDRIISSSTFIRVFQYDLTNDFLSSLDYTLDKDKHHEKNTILCIQGFTGSGKSTSGISLVYEVIQDRFVSDNIVFFNKELLDRAEHIDRDNFIIRDEGVRTFGVGSTRETTDVTILAETCRKAGINLIFIEPDEQELGIAKWYLETIDMDIENRITRLGVIEPKSKKYLGSIYVKILDETHPLITQYNKKKDEFISSIRTGSRKKVDFREYALKIINKIDLTLFTTKRERMAYVTAELSNLTTGEIKQVCVWLEMAIEKGKMVLYDEE